MMKKMPTTEMLETEEPGILAAITKRDCPYREEKLM